MDSGDRVHGGLAARELRELGITPASVLDLSASVNPYGPSRAVCEAVAAAPLHRYPDPECWPAREAMAGALDLDASALVLGNGATELLWTLARVLAPSPSPVVIAEPAFGEMRAAAEACGHSVLAVRGSEQRAYAADLEALSAAIRRVRAVFVYLCNPTTPIGAPLATADLAELAQCAPECTVVLDESFLSLSDHHADAAVPLPPNVIRVRSLTKDHALAGLRIGYAIAPPELVRRVERARPSWTVSTLAQVVAPVAVCGGAFVEQSRRWLERDRHALNLELRALGHVPFPSVAPYLAFPVDDARRLRTRLLAGHRVLVRDCSSFGLPDVIRVAVRPEPERTRLIAALRTERDAC